MTPRAIIVAIALLASTTAGAQVMRTVGPPDLHLTGGTLTGSVITAAGACPLPAVGVGGTASGFYKLDIGAAGTDAVALCIDGIFAGYFGPASTPATNSWGNLTLGYGSGLALDLSGGGAGSDAINNTFIGTESGTKVTTAMQNTYVGSRTGHENITGDENTCVGQGSCYENVSGTITSLGYHSHLNHTGGAGGGNTALGWKAMEGVNTTLATGTQNTFIGYEAGLVLGSSVGSTVIGYQAGKALTTGGKNVLVGWRAGDSATTGVDSVIIGREAGQALTSENGNTLIGAGTGDALTDTQVTMVGWDAGTNMTTGTKNVVLGSLAASTLTTGDNNTIIGADADASAATRANCVAVGKAASCAADNGIFLGNSTSTDLFIGTSAHLHSVAPTSVTSGTCTSETLRAGGTELRGEVTATCTAQTWIVLFTTTYTAAPVCVVAAMNAAATAGAATVAYTTSTTALTVTVTTATTDGLWAYQCME